MEEFNSNTGYPAAAAVAGGSTHFYRYQGAQRDDPEGKRVYRSFENGDG